MLDLLAPWLNGDLSPAARVWSAVLPALLVAVYFIGGFLWFLFVSARRGLPVDAETVQRGGTVLLGLLVRHYFFWAISPLWRLLLRSGLPADALTALAGLLGLGAGWAVAAGRFALGGWLFLVAGLLDAVDGRLARARGQTTSVGAALDSVLDRYVDGALLVGLAWYYRDSWVLLPALAAMLGTSLVPYVRARAEALGVPLRGGVMQRAERVVVLGAGVALAPVVEALLHPTDPKPAHGLAIIALVVVAALSNLTAATRLRALVRHLDRQTRRAQPHGNDARILVSSTTASLIATAADFALVVAAVELAGVEPALATLVGAGLGAGLQYLWNRRVTFASSGAMAPQFARHGFVATSSALLNAGGMALLTLHPHLPYAMIWLVVRAAVFLAWNLPLQRGYVFATPALDPPVTLGERTATLRLLPFALVPAGLVLAAVTASPAQAGTVLQPRPAASDNYGESFTFLADLSDGGYVWVQLSVTNIGPGSGKGACRILVVRPGRKPWSVAERFDEDEWRHEPATDTLTVGPCSATAQPQTVVRAALDDGQVELRFSGPPGASHPHAALQVAGGRHATTILHSFAQVTASVQLPGQAAIKGAGGGYADHSRSTVAPVALAKRWVRFRALRGGHKVLLLARIDRDGKLEPAWLWPQGKPLQRLDKLAVRRDGTKKAPAWSIDLQVGPQAWTLASTALLVRSAPVEELGTILAAAVRPIVGSPVTFTHRAVLRTAGEPDVTGLLEVSEED